MEGASSLKEGAPFVFGVQGSYHPRQPLGRVDSLTGSVPPRLPVQPLGRRACLDSPLAAMPAPRRLPLAVSDVSLADNI